MAILTAQRSIGQNADRSRSRLWISESHEGDLSKRAGVPYHRHSSTPGQRRYERAGRRRRLADPPYQADVISLEPMLQTSDLGTAKFRVLLTIVPPYPSREGETMQGSDGQWTAVFKGMVRRTNRFESSTCWTDDQDERSAPQVSLEDYITVGRNF